MQPSCLPAPRSSHLLPSLDDGCCRARLAGQRRPLPRRHRQRRRVRRALHALHAHAGARGRAAVCGQRRRQWQGRGACCWRHCRQALVLPGLWACPPAPVLDGCEGLPACGSRLSLACLFQRSVRAPLLSLFCSPPFPPLLYRLLQSTCLSRAASSTPGLRVTWRPSTAPARPGWWWAGTGARRWRLAAGLHDIMCLGAAWARFPASCTLRADPVRSPYLAPSCRPIYIDSTWWSPDQPDSDQHMATALRAALEPLFLKYQAR